MTEPEQNPAPALSPAERAAIGAVVDAYYEEARAGEESTFQALETLAGYLDRTRGLELEANPPAGLRAPRDSLTLSGRPAPDLDDYDANAYVQDYLSAWSKRHLADGDKEHDTIEAAIELIQETLPARPAEHALDAPATLERATWAGLDATSLESCGDCGDPVGWNETAQSWQHVFPARPTCWMVHGNGATLDAPAPAELCAVCGRPLYLHWQGACPD